MNPMHSFEQAPKPETKKIWWLFGGLLAVIILVVIWAAWPRHANKLESVEAKKLVQDNAAVISSASFKNTLAPEISATDHVRGDINAKISLVVYEDISQSFSADLDKSLEQLKNNYGEKIRIAYRSFPASGPFALKVAKSLDCAFNQDKGWEFRRDVLAIVESRSLSDDDLGMIVKNLSLDQAKFDACDRDQKNSDDLVSQTKEAAKYGVIGSPTLFIGDEMINGARPLTDFVDSGGDKIEGLNSIIQKKLQ